MLGWHKTGLVAPCPSDMGARVRQPPAPLTRLWRQEGSLGQAGAKPPPARSSPHGRKAFFAGQRILRGPSCVAGRVALGDLITNGTLSEIDFNRRWPDIFVRRLAAAGIRMAVVNGEIGGGRVLEDDAGPNALGSLSTKLLPNGC
jgi:hypothetical protein